GLGHVLHGDGRVLGHQERAANREACVLLSFRDAGFLQQLQRPAACTDEQELGVGTGGGAVFQVLVFNVPRAVVVARDVVDFAGQLQVKVRAGLQVGHVLTGDFTPVDVGTDRRPGGRQLLRRIAAFHHQRDPLGDLRRVFGILHRAEQRAGLQRVVTLLEEFDVVIAPHEAHVRSGVDERRRVLQDALANLPGEELTGDLKGFVDFDGFGDVDLAVFVFRRVVQLGKAGVTGAGVVPAVGAFFCDGVEALDHFHRPARLQLIEPYAQGRTHDAAADQQYIDFLAFCGMGLQEGCRNRQAQQSRAGFLEHRIIH
nr:hypothetical protein [Tanacetum cinerariifolium]